MTRGAPSGLPAQAELFDDGAIPPHIIAIEVTQEPSPLADHLQKAAPRRMVVLVLPEVIREFGDPSREDSHLDLDRAFIGRVPPMFLDYRRLRRLVQLVSVSCEFPQIKYRTARWNRTRVSAIYTGLFVENPHAKKRRPRGRTKYNTQGRRILRYDGARRRRDPGRAATHRNQVHGPAHGAFYEGHSNLSHIHIEEKTVLVSALVN